MSSACLVVDDEPDVERLITQRFRADIRAGKFAFYFAHDGMEALDTLGQHEDIDMILTDINMPRMDGLTLLAKSRSINPIARTVVVSAYGDMDNIRSSMNHGAFDFITKPINFDDLRITIEKTLEYVAEVRRALADSRQNNILRMYVNPSFINYLDRTTPDRSEDVAENVNRRFTGSILFVDICGFTSLSETLNPDDIAKLLNQYFEEFARGVGRHGGTIDKFIGDAVLAVFEGEGHLARVVEAALDIRDTIGALTQADLIPGVPNPQVSMGVNSGELIAGHFGSSSLGRYDYTVIGDTVNTASRLQGHAQPREILLPHSLVESIGASYSFELVGPIVLKNKRAAVEVSKLNGRG